MNWSAFATLAILASTIHWLVARAQISRPFWDATWLPERINALLSCPACSGFWLGLGLGALGLQPIELGPWWLRIGFAGVAGVFGTPLGEAVLLWALDRTRIR